MSKTSSYKKHRFRNQFETLKYIKILDYSSVITEEITYKIRTKKLSSPQKQNAEYARIG